MNIVAIIEARMASTRLPGKVLLPAAGKPLLVHMVERLRYCHALDANIALATTQNDVDGILSYVAKMSHIEYHKGSEEDVMMRVLETAMLFHADIIVELTGDCPLIDAAMVDKVVSDYLLGGADFVYNRLEPGTPIGMDVRVFSTTALAEVAAKTQDPADREHVSLYFWEHPDEYRCRNVYTALPPGAGDYRLTVDTVEDYELVRRIFEELYPYKPYFTLYDIIELLKLRPELAAINRDVKQKDVR